MKQATLTQADLAFENVFVSARVESARNTGEDSHPRVLPPLDSVTSADGLLLNQFAKPSGLSSYVGKSASIAMTERYRKARADAGVPVPPWQEARANTGRYNSEEGALAAIVEKLVAALDPREIWLFGSRATGRSRPDSDFDMLIVAKPGGVFGSEDYELVDKPLRGSGIGCDIVPCSAEDFEVGLSLNTTLVTRVVNEGRLIYEAALK